jgi:hypothetical protein
MLVLARRFWTSLDVVMNRSHIEASDETTQWDAVCITQRHFSLS